MRETTSFVSILDYRAVVKGALRDGLVGVEELASRSGVSRSTIYRVRWDRCVTYENVYKMTDAVYRICFEDDSGYKAHRLGVIVRTEAGG